MKQKYILHLKIYIFFLSCLVLKTDSLGCQCCQCREPINDLVSGVVLKRKLDVGFAPFSLYRKGNRHSFSKYDGNRSQFSRDVKNIPVNLSRSTDISIKISPTRTSMKAKSKESCSPADTRAVSVSVAGAIFSLIL